MLMTERMWWLRVKRWVRQPRGVLVCAILVLVAAITVLGFWTPFGWLLAPHRRIRQVLYWIHDHWLNAPALTAAGTLLLVVATLSPLLISQRNRRRTSS